jgi:hypothetical protein
MRKAREIAAATKTKTSRNAAVANPSPTVESTQDVAAQVRGMLDQIEGLVPGFQHHDRNEVKRVAAVAHFAHDLIPQVITAVSALPPVGGVNTFDVERGKAALAFDADWQPVVQRLSALLEGVQFTIDSRLAVSADQALSTYAWAKKHARGAEGIALRPYLDTMKRTMKQALNRNRRKPPATDPTPAPTGSQGFLSPNLAQANAAKEEYDLPDDFRQALEEAVKE